MKRDENGLTIINKIINLLPWRSKYEPLYGITSYHKKMDLYALPRILKSEKHIHVFYKRREIFRFNK